MCFHIDTLEIPSVALRTSPETIFSLFFNIFSILLFTGSFWLLVKTERVNEMIVTCQVLRLTPQKFNLWKAR
jgi:hypothetical protein